MIKETDKPRMGRVLKRSAYAILVAAIIAGGAIWDAQAKEGPESKAVAVSAVEDLMREHGVLRRILLIYEECIKRLDNDLDLPLKVLQDSAGLVRAFIENYHEKLEENYIFPGFEKANRSTDLVKTLRAQHEAGRRITEEIMDLAGKIDLKNKTERGRLAELMKRFVAMYRPHASREDTVLFPEFKKLVSKKEYAALADEFEDEENMLFGEEGFFKIVEQVAALEKTLDIYELSKFTPRSGK